MKACVLACIFSIFSWSATAQITCGSLRYQDSIFHSVDTTLNIQYGTADPFGLGTSQNLFLDLYQPANDTQKHRPLIMFMHGGSFIDGSKGQTIIPAYATYFAKCGYVVASIDYRVGFNPLSTGSAERAVYRAIQDLRASIRFLCQRADTFGIDTNTVILTGTSAGCIAGLCSAFITEAQFPSAIHGTLTESSDLGGIDSSGNTDFGNRYVKPRAIISHWGAILDTTYITDADSMPVLCIQGTADPVVPYIEGNPYGYPIFPVVYGSLPITTRLKDLGVRNKLVPLPGMAHEPELQHPEINDTMNNDGRLFLWSLLKPATPHITGSNIVCHQIEAHYTVTHHVGSNYCWQLTGNGIITYNTGDSINVLWSDTGMVSVTATEINYMGASADPVTYNTRVLAPVQALFTYGIYDLSGRFFNQSKYTDSVFWSFGNGDTSHVYNPTEPYTPGNYSATLIAYNRQCAVSDTFSQTVIVDTCPVVHFTFSASGMNGFFAADTSNTFLYDWNFGDGSTANVSTTHVLHAYAHNGTYPVVLSEMSAQGCLVTDTVMVNIYGAFVDDLSADFVSVKCNLSDNCELKFNQSADWNIEVYDMVGNLLTHQKALSDIDFQTSGFKPGVYLLKVYNDSQVLVTKFIRQ